MTPLFPKSIKSNIYSVINPTLKRNYYSIIWISKTNLVCAIKLMSFFTTRHAPNDKLKNYHSSEFIKYDVDVLVRLSSGTKNAPCRKGKSKIISLVFQEGSISFLFQIHTINEMVCHFIEQPRRPPAAQRLVSFNGRVPQSGWSTCAVMLIPYTRKRISPS